MKTSDYKKDFRKGLLVSIAFPLIFLSLDTNPSNIGQHFISSFAITFSFWNLNFLLIDFKKSRIHSKGNGLFIYYGRFIASFIVAIVIYILVGLLFNRSADLLSQLRGNWGNSINSWFYLCVKIILFNALIILIKYLFDSNAEKRKVELENEVLKRENINALHETLKQQVNPHFLFNSLNTLKSLTKRNPDQAIHFINELSSVYRYMLLHQDKKIVSLGEEIEFLKSYLYLLKIRFGDAINTQINLPDAFLKYTMPPNTLQLLIENAVKHNALSVKKPLQISIHVKDDYLIVQNNLQDKTQLTASSHIGLSNISGRYLLLKGKKIIIKKTDESFSVLLPII